MTTRRAFDLPVSRYANRFWWSWATTIPLMVIWGVTAEKGGSQWPVAIAYIATMIMLWTVPSAEQVVKMIQAAGVLKSDPMSTFSYGPSSAGVEVDPDK